MRSRMLAALAASFVLASTALAETPIPDYPKDGVATAGVDERLDSLRAFLKSFKSGAGASYHVCVVAFTHPKNERGADEQSGLAYVDAVFAKWKEKLDPERHVVIVVSIENRNIGVHPGSL